MRMTIAMDFFHRRLSKALFSLERELRFKRIWRRNLRSQILEI